MSKHFAHLHVHTDYSLLDGAISLDKYIAFGKEHNFRALAITDHGNLFGAVKFFQKCKKAGIKPVLGIEAYLTEDATIKRVDKKYYHIILLVENEIGYKNLCKLISFSYQKGFYFKPRIDYQILEQYSEGLIATSGCLGGHIPQLLKHEQYTQVDAQIDWFLKVFGPDRFYLEIQPEDQEEQKILNEKLYLLSEQKKVKLVATGDCHYVSPEDRQAHEVMLSIQTQGKLSDPSRYSFGACRVHLRTEKQMLEIFHAHEHAIWNTGDIADRCNFDFATDTLHFPKFDIPHNHTPESFFKAECNAGLQELLTQNLIEKKQEEVYQQRLDQEIELITRMGFVGYFLIVSDFIKWAKRHSIPVGPGRGSAAGALVAWTLEITNIDPIKYNLLFERFLNPERISMPDIDIDFCIEGREAVINYVRDRYGHRNVGQIITFGTMLAKGVIKDVARVMGLPFEDAQTITTLIPDQLGISLHEAVEKEPRLKELLEQNSQAHRIFDIAYRLEGLTRHASKHAAGIVITPEPIDEVLPVYVPSKSNELVTQYAMSELESIGFLKIDFLGLKNLTIVARAIKSIEKNHTIRLDMDHIPLDDHNTFELIRAGKTSGVFQLESDGLKEVLRKLKPEKFEDIIAVNALYRPGPLGSGMVDDFIERKHGRQKIQYLFDQLIPILEETYGVIVYQEQVMKIASTIAGYSLGESDILRRAMGKKKVEVMQEQRKLFLQRATDRSFNPKKVGELFDLMAYFAGYGFNKSHSAAYALIAYQTAFLKANYPAEFMASLITLETGNADKMSFYLQETRDMGLKICPPNINQSEIEFAVVDQNIVFGLQGIKNVGQAALENIVMQRREKPFENLLEFCIRIDLRTANKRVIESLICAGAFDTLPGNRAQQLNELPLIFERALEKKRALETGQMGLFNTAHHTDPTHVDEYQFAPCTEWNTREKLEKEKEVIGFYLSAHPIDSYDSLIGSIDLLSFQDALETVSQTQQEPTVTCIGLVNSYKQIVTKKGDRMAFAQLEDQTAKAEVIIFPKLYKKVEAWLEQYQVFIIKGNRDVTAVQTCKIKAIEFIPLDLFFEQWPHIQSFTIDIHTAQEATDATNLMHPGTVQLHINFEENQKKLTLISQKKVEISRELIETLQKKHNLKTRITLKS